MIKLEVYLDDNKKIVYINPETGEIVNNKKSKVKEITDLNSEPEILLEANKYTLNNAAMDVLKVYPGNTLEILIQKDVPVIGKSSTLKVKTGNKITAKNTVSYRGKNNEALANYGKLFKLEATDTDGIFRMIGDVEGLPVETEEISNPDDIDNIDDLIKEIDTNKMNFNFNL